MQRGSFHSFHGLMLVLRGRARLKGRVLPILAMVVVTAFLALILLGSSRSFLVEARTDGMLISFSEGQNIWRLPDSILCKPLAAPSLVPDTDCGAAAASDGIARERFVDWSDGAVVELYGRDDGGLEVVIIESSGSDLPENSKIVLSKNAWHDTGALTFQASVVVGQDMQAGARKFLYSGRWEAREAGVVTSFFRSITEIIKVGELATGSKVSILANGQPAKVYGHVIPSTQDGLEVTMISELGKTALAIRHFGLDHPVIIEPDWIDIAISSPLLLAMAVLFSVLASVSQIVSGPADLEKGSRRSRTDSED